VTDDPELPVLSMIADDPLTLAELEVLKFPVCADHVVLPALPQAAVINCPATVEVGDTEGFVLVALAVLLAGALLTDPVPVS